MDDEASVPYLRVDPAVDRIEPVEPDANAVGGAGQGELQLAGGIGGSKLPPAQVAFGMHRMIERIDVDQNAQVRRLRAANFSAQPRLGVEHQSAVRDQHMHGLLNHRLPHWPVAAG